MREVMVVPPQQPIHLLWSNMYSHWFRRSVTFAFAVATLCGLAACRRADPAVFFTLPAVFSDHMVLQRGLPVHLWGKADPGGRIVVEMAGGSTSAVAGSDSLWSVYLPAMEAGGPYELLVAGSDTLAFSDVMIGDVWICSGQSNMEWSVRNSDDAEAEIGAADWPEIRLFEVAHNAAYLPEFDVQAGTWLPVTSGSIESFSAVAYYFGREVFRETGIPIGLVSTNWGGTPAEAWTSRAGLASFPSLAQTADELAASGSAEAYVAERTAAYDTLVAAWQRAVGAADDGWRDGEPVFAANDFDDSGWSTMELPQVWERAGLSGYEGVVWFRKTFEVPAWLTNQQMLLLLGNVDDRDETWINGVKVGETDRNDVTRIYPVASDVLHPGTNVVTVRVLDIGGQGGFTGQEGEMRIEPAGPSNAMPIPLSGTWRYRKAPLPEGSAPPRAPPRIQNLPAALYNGMVAPLTPYPIKGAIWYQGESNTSRAFEYRRLFARMIQDWREQWEQGNFPFLFVQLANFMEPQTEPGEESEWAELREAQLMALELPNTGMAVTIDIGDAGDIHPKNKQEVGRRLAQNALAIAYGRDVEPSGPRYESLRVEGSEVHLLFSHTGDGLEARGAELKGFAIAGPDSEFVWGEAKIEGDEVVVSSSMVGNPVAVRYGWGNNPATNLYNSVGLPASPFRTDDWPAITQR